MSPPSNNERATRAVAVQVGVDDAVDEVFPEDEAGAVARLQREGPVVAMVGDGVNDGANLTQADLGLAMGTKADLAIQASDLMPLQGGPRGHSGCHPSVAADARHH